jgi:hypothetical protein
VHEIAGFMPADAVQARLAAEIVMVREMMRDTFARSNAPGLTVEQVCRVRRAAADLTRTASTVARELARRQQHPAPFFGTVLADGVDIAALDAVWCAGDMPQPATLEPATGRRCPRALDPVVRSGPGTARRLRRSGRAGWAAGLVPRSRAAERLVALAEVESQAAWRAAIAFARAAKRAARAERAARAAKRTKRVRAVGVRAAGGKACVARFNAIQRENATRGPGRRVAETDRFRGRSWHGGQGRIQRWMAPMPYNVRSPCGRRGCALAVTGRTRGKRH